MTPFASEQERKAAVRALPDITEVERNAIKAVAMNGGDAEQLEAALVEAIPTAGAEHVEWLAYFLRVQAHQEEMEDELLIVAIA